MSQSTIAGLQNYGPFQYQILVPEEADGYFPIGFNQLVPQIIVELVANLALKFPEPKSEQERLARLAIAMAAALVRHEDSQDWPTEKVVAYSSVGGLATFMVTRNNREIRTAVERTKTMLGQIWPTQLNKGEYLHFLAFSLEDLEARATVAA